MKKTIRDVMLVCVGLNLGIVAFAATVNSSELALVGVLSIVSCAVGYILNGEDDV